MPRLPKSLANFTMKGCSMPAPAPCATTKQALHSAAAFKSPDTRVVALTAIVIGLASELSTET
jgi:hypothetical protein